MLPSRLLPEASHSASAWAEGTIGAEEIAEIEGAFWCSKLGSFPGDIKGNVRNPEPPGAAFETPDAIGKIPS